MKFKITLIQTLKGTDYLYLDVEFLEGGRVVHRNDFIMQIAPTHTAYTGREGPNGERLDEGPEYYEETDTDVPAEILANIRRYVARSAMRRFDNRDLLIVSEDTDPLGLRARPGVVALIGTEVAV